MTTPEDVYRLLGERLGRESTPATEKLEASRHTALFREHDVFLVRARDFDAFPHCRFSRWRSCLRSSRAKDCGRCRRWWLQARMPRPGDVGRMEVSVNKEFAVTCDITVVGNVAVDSGDERAF